MKTERTAWYAAALDVKTRMGVDDNGDDDKSSDDDHEHGKKGHGHV